MNPLYQIIFSIGYVGKLLLAGCFGAYMVLCVTLLLCGGGA